MAIMGWQGLCSKSSHSRAQADGVTLIAMAGGRGGGSVKSPTGS